MAEPPAGPPLTQVAEAKKEVEKWAKKVEEREKEVEEWQKKVEEWQKEVKEWQKEVKEASNKDDKDYAKSRLKVADRQLEVANRQLEVANRQLEVANKQLDLASDRALGNSSTGNQLDDELVETLRRLTVKDRAGQRERKILLERVQHLWHALTCRRSEIEEKGHPRTGSLVIELPAGVGWLPQSTLGLERMQSKLIARARTILLWRHLLEERKRVSTIAQRTERRVLSVSGTSGIGKSCDINYYLYKAAEELSLPAGPSFLTVDLALRNAVKGDVNEKVMHVMYRLASDGSVQELSCKPDDQTGLLHISDPHEGIPSLWQPFVVVVHSPREKYTGHLAKESISHTVLYAFPWTREEVDLYIDVFGNTNAYMREAFDYFGGSLRSLIQASAEGPSEWRMKVIRETQKLTQADMEYVTLKHKAGFESSGAGVRHNLLHMLPRHGADVTDARCQYRVDFPSTDVCALVFRYHTSLVGTSLLQFVTDAIKSNGSAAGGVFASCAHVLFTAPGLKWTYHELDTEKRKAQIHEAKQFSIPVDAKVIDVKVAYPQQFIKNLLEGQQRYRDTASVWLVRPRSQSYDAIDAFLVLILAGKVPVVLALQETVGQTHSFHPVFIKYRRDAFRKSSQACHFHYGLIVPDAGFNNFTLQQDFHPQQEKSNNKKSKKRKKTGNAADIASAAATDEEKEDMGEQKRKALKLQKQIEKAEKDLFDDGVWVFRVGLDAIDFPDPSAGWGTLMRRRGPCLMTRCNTRQWTRMFWGLTRRKQRR